MHFARFQNCAITAISFINASKHTLLVGMCWFTHPDIFKAVLEACRRNVRVKIMLDFDHINFHQKGLDFRGLEKAGAAVLVYSGPGLLHFKFAVADGCQVLCGSYNWTRTEQCDHVAVIQDTTLATQFSEGFDFMACKCSPLSQMVGQTPRQVSFSQLYQPTLWSVHDLKRNVLSGAKTWLAKAKSEKDWLRWVSHQRHYLSADCGKIPWITDDAFWDEPLFRQWIITPFIKSGVRQMLKRYCLHIKSKDILVAIAPTGSILGVGVVGSDPEVRQEQAVVFSRFVQWLTPGESRPDFVRKLPPIKAGITRYKGSAMELIASIEPLL